jgi:hypothetical protein
VGITLGKHGGKGGIIYQLASLHSEVCFWTVSAIWVTWLTAPFIMQAKFKCGTKNYSHLPAQQGEDGFVSPKKGFVQKKLHRKREMKIPI